VLTIKAVRRESPIAGTGLFAAEPIAQGAVIWRATPVSVLILSQEAVRALPDDERAFVEWFGYIWHGAWNINVDDAKFMNHSEAPNTVNAPDGSDVTLAARDIDVGEELTCDYRTFHEGFRPFPAQ